MKADERAFLIAVLAEHGWRPYHEGCLRMVLADELAAGLHPKRVRYLLEKWSDKGWWDYGVTARSGWFTPEGIAALKSLRGEPQASPPRSETEKEVTC